MNTINGLPNSFHSVYELVSLGGGHQLIRMAGPALRKDPAMHTGQITGLRHFPK